VEEGARTMAALALLQVWRGGWWSIVRES
jgi:hypothetical protein